MADEPHHFSRQAEELIAALRRLPNESSTRMRKRPTKELGPLIENLLVANQIGRDSPEQAIRSQWEAIVGAANAHYSHPARIERDRTLVVLASHSVVRNELFLHRKLIVGKIQMIAGCAHVKELHITSG